MSWRTVVITKRCKLDLKMGFMVMRAENVTRVFLDEIAVLIIESTAVSLTAILLEALVRRKVKVIFCDGKHLPLAELMPYSAHFSSPMKLQIQTAWDADLKAAVWSTVISEKMRLQANFLTELGQAKEAGMIRGYLAQLEPLDPTHREAHAAKVYFSAVFGNSFKRDEDTPLTAALNYGYSILLAAVSREIAACGYSTQLGLFHHNVFNGFNLASDLMEPFRVFVDRKVHGMRPETFGTDEKHSLVTLLEDTVVVDSEKQTLLNAVRMYVRSVFDMLETGDFSRFKHCQPE